MIDLAIVIPTFNESANVEPLLDALEAALGDLRWEAVFVDDDSTDGTSDKVRKIARERSNVRILERIGRRGLSSACIEGILSGSAPYIVVMDADLQHDESQIPRMLATLKKGNFDIVVASRFTDGGSVGGFAAHRRFLSEFGKKLSQFVCKCQVTDPMSGFFLLTREFFEEVVHSLSAISFKILVDILASSTRPVRLAEVPYTFRDRLHGESKLDTTNLLEYLFLLVDKVFQGFIPVRFVFYSLSGFAGMTVHALTLWLLFVKRRGSFEEAQAIATFVAMTVNFLVNNSVTYRDRRLRGARLFIGLLWFYAACSVGALASFAIATLAFEKGFPWYGAAAFGVIISSVWNYAVTSALTWQQEVRRKSARRRVARPA
jgi:dolichol-phosphate mannosyltransferase